MMLNLKPKNCWRIGDIDADGDLCYVGKEEFRTPCELLAYANEHRQELELSLSGMLFLHLYRTKAVSTCHIFYTLAAANRFHKSQLKARVSLPASPRSKIKQPA